MQFRDEYQFLSNFWLAPIVIQDWRFPSVENAYQAAKTMDPYHWDKIAQMTPGQAKRYGKTVPLRTDWHDIKIEVMGILVQAKFDQHPDLKQRLIATGSLQLIEENSWGDTFWGQCNGTGQNHLGRILMRVRNQENKVEKLTSS